MESSSSSSYGSGLRDGEKKTNRRSLQLWPFSKNTKYNLFWKYILSGAKKTKTSYPKGKGKISESILFIVQEKFSFVFWNFCLFKNQSPDFSIYIYISWILFLWRSADLNGTLWSVMEGGRGRGRQEVIQWLPPSFSHGFPRTSPRSSQLCPTSKAKDPPFVSCSLYFFIFENCYSICVFRRLLVCACWWMFHKEHTQTLVFCVFGLTMDSQVVSLDVWRVNI